MVVACSDSRVDPAILLGTEPGELFVIRNVANLVPRYEPDDRARGTSSAIEFGVRDLGVRHVVVLGHSRCGGIQALRRCCAGDLPAGREFIGPWVKAHMRACEAEPPEGDGELVERAAIEISLENLMTFPWIADPVATKRLSLHGWWFDLQKGQLWAYDAKTGIFAPMA